MALTPLAPRLRGFRVVLASTSPRRKEILALAGVEFEVIPSAFEEALPAGATPRAEDHARDMATGKALEVATRADEADARSPRLIIGADTVVEVDGLILGKPSDREDAERMLRRLSGRRHRVVTGIAVVIAGGVGSDPEVLCSFHEETRVTFSELSDAMVRAYVDTGEPADKAGAYGIQARGAMLVERVDGDALNAAGFPLNRFCREVARALPDRK
ncbi:LOW QUALITY PROTEIN: probable bifunctional dTTP/UTP pyrophosphatase/methyltransferase protein [Apodemus sylvaticus]|uniref:LOW QUALITY PROTEIN: probable bifunctional dTTP/UTP pyrophosphatase/methyltransferase protein n=1 Tax=Apodemus sylvaticus TaxID=10129 RepID=UPI0022428708|nr:LOW QUALITY PROTEIN: probable bifunctional dTTP/UTP pyrophosphatase/methyltransferase protein [Apodemus sylvaticus]